MGFQYFCFIQMQKIHVHIFTRIRIIIWQEFGERFLMNLEQEEKKEHIIFAPHFSCVIRTGKA